jgi:release factor glutamine methyltransferase
VTDRTVGDRLRAAGCLAADEEAAAIVGAAPDEETREQWLRRREQGEPLAWIIGTVEFCGRTLHVDRGVYVPRAQSEQLARRAAALLPLDGGRAIDLCTGVGAVAAHLSAAVPTATVIGVELDERAARCARRNGVGVVIGDLAAPLRPGRVDIVTAVAPYVPRGSMQLLASDVQRYEPALALDGGVDGLGVVRRVVVAASRLLRPGGWLLTELGGDQDEALRPTLTASGFGPPVPWFDDDGDLRGVAASAR